MDANVQVMAMLGQDLTHWPPYTSSIVRSFGPGPASHGCSFVAGAAVASERACQSKACLNVTSAGLASAVAARYPATEQWRYQTSPLTSRSTQVLELWDDPSIEAASRPIDERHFVRVIYNRNPAGVHGASPDEPMTLAEFRRRVMQPFAVADDGYVQACRVEHDANLPQVDSSSY
jgi:hypothetical protein